LTQGVPPGIPTLEAMAKAYLRERYHKPGNVYLGIPYRLDRPVSGVVVFARNTKAARRLAEKFHNRQVRKVYWAVAGRRAAASVGAVMAHDAEHVRGQPGVCQGPLTRRTG
jgi:23S rRNA pseudouridine1911/1915/1917 synthase